MELIAGITAIGILLMLVCVALVSGRAHLRAYLARHAAHQRTFAEHTSRERELDPRYQAKVEADRRFWLAQQEMDLKRFLAMSRIEVSQYGTYTINVEPEHLLHLPPIHKPLQLKEREEPSTILLPAARTFSQVLTTFQPSQDRLFLADLAENLIAESSAKGLCHVALAGATGGGKSTIVRLLIGQLCFVGASVLLLNPHYTRYDVLAHEDWTPFEPYLYDDPMKCRSYDVIREYLRQMAEEMLPTRLDRYAHSQAIGKPFYVVLDELPAIVKHVPEAPGYMADLLREGRKVGLFLVTAAQDFLVKTIMKEEGGALRDCFRTAIYVGGDPTTARVLLDVKGNVDDGGLGKGVVMLRSAQVKQAQLARIPYVDNESLYQLLGPSTYKPATNIHGASVEAQGEQDEGEYSDCPDTVIVEADMPEIGERADHPSNVRAFPKQPVEAQGEQDEGVPDERPKKYHLTNDEITGFIAAYKVSGNMVKSLAAIGKGSRYRDHARLIITVYGLREEAE